MSSRLTRGTYNVGLLPTEAGTLARVVEDATITLAVDHLMNNASIASLCMLEEATEITNFTPVMGSEIEELKLKLKLLTESKTQLEILNQELTEESAYAKGLALAAGVELTTLSEEVTKLMKDKEKLVTELSSLRNSNSQRRPVSSGPRTNIRRDSQIVTKKKDREMLLEKSLKEKEQRECELLKKVEESEKKEVILENELSNMWQLVAKLKKAHEMEAHKDMEDNQS